ncbi:MAG: rpsU-divergently transcribed protein [Alphaproteobacteria bacterium]|nr:rpsU-divergently transcribed protein [Alphaproteobacteria bacterium]
MTDAPKKPRAKKAAPKVEAPKTEAPRDDAALKEAVLAAALPHAAFDGFTDKVLEQAGAEAGVSKSELARLFEGGPLSLVEYYSEWADARMVAGLGDIASLKIRARIAAAVKARLAALAPNKEAARRAAALLSLPMNAALGAKLLYRTVDAMWRAAGDTSTDFNFYTKRGILAGVYASTAMRWFTTEDEAVVDEFLAARIENVMQIEKFKAKAKEALANFPAFANFGKPRT